MRKLAEIDIESLTTEETTILVYDYLKGADFRGCSIFEGATND